MGAINTDNIDHNKPLKTLKTRVKKVKFSSIEDNFIISGIRKYGAVNGQLYSTTIYTVSTRLERPTPYSIDLNLRDLCDFIKYSLFIIKEDNSEDWKLE